MNSRALLVLAAAIGLLLVWLLSSLSDEGGAARPSAPLEDIGPDARPRADLPRVPAGTMDLETPDRSPATDDEFAAGPTQPGPATTGRVDAPRAKITGQVVDRTGVTLSSHYIHVERPGAARSDTEVPPQLTDAEGRFKLTDVPAGRAEFWIILARDVRPQFRASATDGPRTDGLEHGHRLAALDVTPGMDVDLGRLVADAPLPYHLQGLVPLHVQSASAGPTLQRMLRVQVRLEGDDQTVYHALVRLDGKESYGWLGRFDFVHPDLPARVDLRVMWGRKMLLQLEHTPTRYRPDQVTLGDLMLEAHVSSGD